MKKEILGTMKCPECGHDAAEVKAQKNGLPYRYCPECDAQYFARTTAAADRLWLKIGQSTQGGRSVTVTEAGPVASPPAALPKPKGTGNALLDFVAGAAR